MSILYVAHQLKKHVPTEIITNIDKMRKVRTYVLLAMNTEVDGETYWTILKKEYPELARQAKSFLKHHDQCPIVMEGGTGFVGPRGYVSPKDLKMPSFGFVNLIRWNAEFPKLDKYK